MAQITTNNGNLESVPFSFLRKFILVSFLIQFQKTTSALKNRRAIMDGGSATKLDVLVVGPGGSGSSELIRHISKFFECNSLSDRDGLKHLPYPPKNGLAKKIIFVYNDLTHVRQSLARREFTLLQVLKLRPPGSPFGNRNYWNLGFLVEMQERRFRPYSDIDTLFIHYNELFESAEVVSEFLGRTENFVETFPKRRVSASRL